MQTPDDVLLAHTQGAANLNKGHRHADQPNKTKYKGVQFTHPGTKPQSFPSVT